MKALHGTPLKRFHRRFRRAHPIRHAIALVLQSVEYPVNVGSIFRIADATRMEELVLTGITPTPPHPTIARVGRGKHARVPWRYAEQPATAISDLREGGYRIFALEITEGAQPYYEVDWPERVCLVVGHEDHGITRATLDLCDEAVFVPMWGKGASLNVHVTVAVVAYHIRCRGLVGQPAG